jgi:hypothetical protein
MFYLAGRQDAMRITKEYNFEQSDGRISRSACHVIVIQRIKRRQVCFVNAVVESPLEGIGQDLIVKVHGGEDTGSI